MKHLALFTTFLFFVSCATVKRNGYYQTRTYTVKQVKRHSSEKKPEHQVPEFSQVGIHTTETNTSLNDSNNSSKNSHTSGNSKGPIAVPTSSHKSTLDYFNKLSLQDSCDLIIMKDGDEIEGKVLEITETEIKFKRCDYLDGPTIVVSKENVFMIKYKNGSREVFATQAKTEPAKTERPNSSSNGSTRGIGWFLLIIGLIMILFISILLGAIIVALGIVLIIR